ncbi:MAG: aminoacyl-tRNA hydrolase [Arsenophonus endosymbiont of Ceratovacuna japonica]
MQFNKKIPNIKNIISNIKLIVGLANPGFKYSLTRHNIGSWYVKLLAKKYKKLLKEESKFFGYTTTINLENNNIYLLIPTTYINLSGKSVLALSSFYRIKIDEILVAHDELDLMPGIVKIKLGGNNSGHNGIKDIQSKLGNHSNFYRLRIGIGHPGDKNKVIDFLLNKPTVLEQKLIINSINKAIYYTPIILNENINKAINLLHTFNK